MRLNLKQWINWLYHLRPAKNLHFVGKLVLLQPHTINDEEIEIKDSKLNKRDIKNKKN